MLSSRGIEELCQHRVNECSKNYRTTYIFSKVGNSIFDRDSGKTTGRGGE